MKKGLIRVAIASLIMLIGSFCFAQNFPADRKACYAVFERVANGTMDSNYCEIDEIVLDADAIIFDYVWFQKGLLLSSSTQYRVKVKMLTEETSDGKIFTLTMDNTIYSRNTNNDGSPKSGTPRNKYEHFRWEEATGVVNKLTVINSVKKDLTENFTKVLNATEDDYNHMISQLQNTEELQKYFR